MLLIHCLYRSPASHIAAAVHNVLNSLVHTQLLQVKNRESAARSRQRKQAYTNDLEAQVDATAVRPLLRLHTFHQLLPSHVFPINCCKPQMLHTSEGLHTFCGLMS